MKNTDMIALQRKKIAYDVIKNAETSNLFYDLKVDLMHKIKNFSKPEEMSVETYYYDLRKKYGEDLLIIVFNLLTDHFTNLGYTFDYYFGEDRTSPADTRYIRFKIDWSIPYRNLRDCIVSCDIRDVVFVSDIETIKKEFYYTKWYLFGIKKLDHVEERYKFQIKTNNGQIYDIGYKGTCQYSSYSLSDIEILHKNALEAVENFKQYQQMLEELGYGDE